MLKCYQKNEAQINLDDASEFLSSFCKQRGYYGGSGIPNESVAAKKILREFVDGNITFCCLPPSQAKVNKADNQSDKVTF